uniref:Uncharacterized protein n=1 Tax=Chenopodium quinoa TaxID=63459 RepID=A0A803KSJ8_CHEQI
MLWPLLGLTSCRKPCILKTEQCACSSDMIYMILSHVLNI